MRDRNNNAKLLSRLKRILAETLVPCAMALAAMAFGAGLYMQVGFGLVASLIASVTLFLVMICAQAAFIGSQRAAYAVDRVNALEMAYKGGLNGDSEQLAQLAAKVAQIDGLSDRVQQIEALAERIEALDHEVTLVRRDRTEVDPARIQRLAAEVDRLDARQEALRTQLQIESRERYEDLSAELQMIETLVKQMAENVAMSKRAALQSAEVAEPQAADEDQAAPPPYGSEGRADGPEAVPDTAPQQPVAARAPEDVREPTRDVHHVQPEPEIPPAPPRAPEMPDAQMAAAPAPTEVAAVEPRPDTPQVPPLAEAEPATAPAAEPKPMIEEVRRSIESNRIELYLQPIMMVPQRRVRYYEALTRLRNDAGELLLPRAYMQPAESAGIMSAIDNVMLFRSVQVLRRLEKRSSARGVFCNISVNSLLDPEFFPEFVAFMEQNRGLAESMYFEFSQAMIEHCGPVEQESLAMLASLGFRFSLDQVMNLDLDYQTMSERGFRFIKVDADVMLNGMDKANAQIHAVDMRSYLERFGIQLIVSKIESEAELARLLEYNIKLGQGFLFSEPRPVRPEIFNDRSSVAAA